MLTMNSIELTVALQKLDPKLLFQSTGNPFEVKNIHNVLPVSMFFGCDKLVNSLLIIYSFL